LNPTPPFGPILAGVTRVGERDRVLRNTCRPLARPGLAGGQDE